MRKLAIVLLLVALAGCRSTTPPVAEASAAEIDELRRLEEAYFSAFSSKDLAKLKALNAPGYTFHWYVRDTSSPWGAKPLVPRYVDERTVMNFKYSPISWGIDHVLIYGDVGVVMSTFTWGAEWEGSFSVKGVLADMWIRRDGRWQLFSSSAEFLPWPPY